MIYCTIVMQSIKPYVKKRQGDFSARDDARVAHRPLSAGVTMRLQYLHVAFDLGDNSLKGRGS